MIEGCFEDERMDLEKMGCSFWLMPMEEGPDMAEIHVIFIGLN